MIRRLCPAWLPLFLAVVALSQDGTQLWRLRFVVDFSMNI